MPELNPDKLTYSQMLDLVAQWYDTDAQTIVDTLNKYDVPYGDMNQLYKLIDKTPYGAMYNSDGSIRSTVYRYITPNIKTASYNAAKNIDSNVQAAEKTEFNMPLESEVAQETGKVSFSSGLKAVGTGAKSALKFTFKEVAPAVAAASAGITLGKTIDRVLYNINPDFWDEKGMSSLNPETWNSITSGDDSTGARLFNMVFGLNPDDSTSQAYMDENALAYLSLYMQNLGLFESNYEYTSSDYPSYRVLFNESNKLTVGYFVGTKDETWVEIPTEGNPKGFFVSESDTGCTPVFVSLNDFSVTEHKYKSSTVTLNNKPFYYVNVPQGSNKLSTKPYYSALFIDNTEVTNVSRSNKEIMGYILLFGDYSEISKTDGIGTQPDATIPDLSDVTDTSGALQKLKETYPELWNNAVSQDVAQPDGTTKHYVYVPVGFPSTTGATDTQPTTGSQTQNNTKIDPKTDPQTLTEDLVKTLTRILTPTNTPNPPSTGGGDAPVVVPVTGAASSLYAIYNPTLAEINSFGAWLWSDNFIEQIKKLFSDPMQAIIGLHKVYATPITGGAQSIKVGYLDSGVSSKIVTNQYTTIDCGTVTLDEYFFNVFDYSPYTEVSLYLPFIGIVNMDVADVMRASIHIIYHVDVLTGACLAEVKVTRDNAGGTLYQYAGSASVTLPISSGSYMGIVASLASIAGGVASTIASGGAAAPMAIGAVGGALNARTKVEHSGSFSGNAGAMGCKIPYLIISRPQTALADNYSAYIGNPANHTTTLGNCSGYVKVTECHLENIPATREELNSIESILKGGVLI